MVPPATPPLGAMERTFRSVTTPPKLTCAPVRSSVFTLIGPVNVVVPVPVRIVRFGVAVVPSSLDTLPPNWIAPPPVYIPPPGHCVEKSPTRTVSCARLAVPPYVWVPPP